MLRGVPRFGHLLVKFFRVSGLLRLGAGFPGTGLILGVQILDSIPLWIYP